MVFVPPFPLHPWQLSIVSIPYCGNGGQHDWRFDDLFRPKLPLNLVSGRRTDPSLPPFAALGNYVVSKWSGGGTSEAAASGAARVREQRGSTPGLHHGASACDPESVYVQRDIKLEIYRRPPWLPSPHRSIKTWPWRDLQLLLFSLFSGHMCLLKACWLSQGYIAPGAIIPASKWPSQVLWTQIMWYITYFGQMGSW